MSVMILALFNPTPTPGLCIGEEKCMMKKILQKWSKLMKGDDEIPMWKCVLTQMITNIIFTALGMWLGIVFQTYARNQACNSHSQQGTSVICGHVKALYNGAPPILMNNLYGNSDVREALAHCTTSNIRWMFAETEEVQTALWQIRRGDNVVYLVSPDYDAAQCTVSVASILITAQRYW